MCDSLFSFHSMTKYHRNTDEYTRQLFIWSSTPSFIGCQCSADLNSPFSGKQWLNSRQNSAEVPADEGKVQTLRSTSKVKALKGHTVIRSKMIFSICLRYTPSCESYSFCNSQQDPHSPWESRWSILEQSHPRLFAPQKLLDLHTSTVSCQDWEALSSRTPEGSSTL